MVDVQGTVADGYEPVRDAFVRNFSERGDTGASLTVHRDGEPVVDLWGGKAPDGTDRSDGTDGTGSHAGTGDDAGTGCDADADADGRAWDADTVVVVRSATKGPAAAVLHILHQRGRLDLDAPVGTYWPEFKANGKERVLVRHLLSHRAGLPVLDTPLTPAQAVDGTSGPAALAAQRVQWEPGTAHGYHAQTYGWLLAEVVRRATGRTIGCWFDEEVARPYGLDLWMGVPPEVERSGRVAPVRDVPTPEPQAARGLRVRPKKTVTDAWTDPESLTRRAFAAITPSPDENDPAYRAAELPSSAGTATARGLSRFYAALIGPLPGARRLFTPATLTQARSEESAGPDRVLVVGTRFGLGFMLHGPSAPMLSPGSFGHPGRGGSLGFADPESGVSFGYVTGGLQNSVTSDPRAEALVRALRGCL